MPAEIRHILFERLEVVQAVRECRAARGQPPLLGSVVHSEVVAEDSTGTLSFKMTVESDDNRRPVTRSDVVIEGPALAAALILHCRRTKIPLPAHAEKSFKVIGDRIGLIATFNAGRDRVALLEQLRG